MLRFGAKAVVGVSSRSTDVAAKCFRSSHYSAPGGSISSLRCFSASPLVSDSTRDTNTVITPDSLAVDVSSVTETIAQLSSSDLGYYPSHIVMSAIENIHLLSGMPYWQAIVIATVGIRIALVPLAISSIKNTTQMSILRPAMAKLKEQQERHPNPDDPAVKLRFDIQTRALFVEHKVNPLKALAMPLIQLPVFLSLYFALNNMGLYFPGYLEGGDFWFRNLTAPDSMYIFPALNALSFLLMVELGSDGFNTENKDTFKWVSYFFIFIFLFLFLIFIYNISF